MSPQFRFESKRKQTDSNRWPMKDNLFRMREIVLRIFILLVIEFVGAQTFGALIAYEPFDYKAGELLLGKTNGFGFSGPWIPAGFNARVPEGFEIRAGRLEFQNLATEGTNHVSADQVPKDYEEIYGLGRTVATNFGIDGTLFYLSYLCRVDAEGEYTSLIVGSGDGAELSVGKS